MQVAFALLGLGFFDLVSYEIDVAFVFYAAEYAQGFGEFGVTHTT